MHRIAAIVTAEIVLCDSALRSASKTTIPFLCMAANGPQNQGFLEWVLRRAEPYHHRFGPEKGRWQIVRELLADVKENAAATCGAARTMFISYLE